MRPGTTLQKSAAAGLALVSFVLRAHAQTDAGAPVFEKDILPIFTQYCFTCHGKTSPKLGLDLRTASSTMKGSHNGPIVVKGSPDQSLLWQKLSTGAMPPEAYLVKLPEEHAQTIRRWIAAGALSSNSHETARDQSAQQASFEKQVLPIFNAKCVSCHGQAKTAGLDLRTIPSLLRGSTSGPVVREGSSEKSILVRKVSSRNMPPAGAGDPLNEAEIQTLRQWIDTGSFADAVPPESHVVDRPFTSAEAPEITPKDREFWSFRKPIAIPPPKVKTAARVRTPIDAFALARLEAKGLTFSPDAPNLTLMRRAYFDLTGLPPTPEEAREFSSDAKPGAYERLIDRLLASPRYGERWGRHWLDAAGYVDTTGKDFDPKKAALSEGIWRYRDYVIKATNSDKPWDRFLTEQIAGDELIDWRSAVSYTPEIVELLAATGFLRTELDNTGTDLTNLPVDRYEALFKLVEQVSSSTMGLTVGCARCHTHKYDPIPQRDYYRFLALFTAAYNPSNWLPPEKRHLYTVSENERKEIDRHNADIDKSVTELKNQLSAVTQPYEKRLIDEKLKAIPIEIRDDTRAAIETPPAKQDDVQKFLAKRFAAALKVSDAEWRKLLNEADRSAVAKIEEKIRVWNGYRRPLEKIQALFNVGPMPSIRLLQRGSAESPGPKVEPGFPTVLSEPGKPDSPGTRLTFAKWLTSREHPLTARVIVNRIWQHHFGRGIVETPDNFGKMGSPPSHPELLDWLAVDFMDHGWSAKRLHKAIMTSTVYRQSSRQPRTLREPESLDAENRLLWRMNLRRVEAEVLRDSMISAAGKLDTTMGGPPVVVSNRPDGLQTAAEYRRSLYLLARRTYPLTFLSVFDYPIIDTNCARRVPSATPLQSLTLMNDEFVVASADHIAKRVNEITGATAPDAKRIETAYMLTLSRQPLQAEIELGEAHLKKQRKVYATANVADSDANDRALASLAQALLGSNEFLYVD